MNTGIKPLGPRVVVQLVAVKETTLESGLVLPQTDSVDTYKADIVEVGPEVERVQVGDLVLLTIGAVIGTAFDHRQDNFAIVDERDILAILDRE